MAIFLGSANFNGTNGSHFYASVYLDSYSQDVNTNTTAYTLHLYAGSVDSYYAYGSAINGYLQGAWSGSATSFPARTQVDMGTYSGTIQHNADGTAWLGVTGSVDASRWGIGSASVSAGWTPPTIPRSASVTATGAAIGEKSTIVINRLTTTFNYTLRYSILDELGTTHQDTIVSKINQDIYEWTLPDVFYQYWRTGNTKYCTIYCDTYNGDKLIGTKSTDIQVRTSMATIPLITDYDFRDMNSRTVALTDDNGVMVQGYSSGRLTFTATLDYYSKVSEVLDENRQPVEYQVVSETDKTQVISVEMEYNDFSSLHQLWVWDGRRKAGRIGIRTNNMAKMPGTIEIIYERIDYILLTMNMSAKRPSATTGEIDVDFSGNYFNGTFGGADNSLDLSWKYRLKGATDWIDGGVFVKDTDYTISENTFESNGAVNLGSTFDYQNIYEIAIFYKDKLVDTYTSKIVPRGLPIFWWNKDGVYDGNNKKFLVEGDASGGDTLPIGAIVDYDGDTVPEGYEQVDYPPIFAEPGDADNSWGKFEFPTHTIYFKYATMLANFNANAWSQLDLGTVGNLPPDISFNSNKMAFLGTALALDSAISLSVGIRNNGDTVVTCTYQNKYTGAIPNSPIRLHFMLMVKK